MAEAGHRHVACPLPELEDALQPYIRARSEVAHVRQVIDRVFNERCGEPDRPITVFTTLYNSDHSSKTYGHESFGSSGVHAIHEKAVVAHQAASRRLQALEHDLAQLHTSSTARSSQLQMNTAQHAIASIRREQRERKLRIIERAVSEIDEQRLQSPYGNTDNVLGMVKQPHGSAPPLQMTAGSERLQDVTTETLRLKTAVIEARSLADKDSVIEAAPPEGFDGEADDSPKVTALKYARNVMIAWLETELAKISENEEAIIAAETDTRTAEADESSTRLIDVKNVYQSYVEARQDLIASLRIAKASPAITKQPPMTERNVAVPEQRPKQGAVQPSALDVLPYAKQLHDVSEYEPTLSQEASFIRRQLASTIEKRNHLVHRLADESHLVPPNAANVREWAQAAERARLDDSKHLQSVWEAGERSIRNAV
ncbi:hypothetical protein AAFC00_001824 [Neodothiora populina]|uniref:Uncharacterized protein n=1 Tax=Neodothiora populina TaxID=2781224 RepID=A0ABR3PQ92_9PEZI